MDYWLIVLDRYSNVFAFEKLLKVFPIVHFLLVLKTVVILIHLDIVWIISIFKLLDVGNVPGKYFSVEPSV